MDVIILAGGKGSRMDDDLPKALVHAKGKPIISRQLDYLSRFDIVGRFIIALGHKADIVVDYVRKPVNEIIYCSSNIWDLIASRKFGFNSKSVEELKDFTNLS